MNHRPAQLAVAPLAAPRPFRDRDVIASGSFLAATEKAESIVPIAKWPMPLVCWQLGKSHEQALPLALTAATISCSHIERGKLAAPMRERLSQSTVKEPAREIEMSPASLIRDPGVLLPRLEELKRLAVSSRTDDFATGYSSLADLRALPAQGFTPFAKSFGDASARMGADHVELLERKSVRGQS